MIYNIDLLKVNKSRQVEHFINMLSSYSFYPSINNCTRISDHSSTLIDNIFTNVSPTSISEGIFMTDISDHFPIFNILNISLPINKKNVNDVYKRNTSSRNIANLKQYLSETDWYDVFSCRDPQAAYSNFSNYFINAFKYCCPLTNCKINPKYVKSPWITRGILISIRHKNKLYSRLKAKYSILRQETYSRYRNILTTVINFAKKSYYHNAIDDNKNNSSGLWKIINTILGKKQNNVCHTNFTDNGHVIHNENEIATHFNNYFSSVASNLSNKLPGSNYDPLIGIQNNNHTFVMFPTCTEEVISMIINLKNSNSSGHDGITNYVLKQTIEFIATPLSHIINLSFSYGLFPSELKIAKVIPIFKSDDPKIFSNYRPISLLPSISKLFERLVYNRLMVFIEKHSILHPNQYGFRKNYSTYMAAVNLSDLIASGLDNKLCTVGIFIDLSKAFDTIDHNILLRKLYCYGIRGLSYDWFKSYLNNRSHYVYYNNNCSSKSHSCTGVPQGSILGPLLFLLYINDICTSSHKGNFVLFADDTTVLFQNDNLQDAIIEAENEFSHILNWLNANKLSLNIKKTKVLIFDNKIPCTTDIILNIGGTLVSSTSTAKFLGTIIDNKLNWNDHISFVSKKIARANGIICRLKHYLPKKTLLTLYNTLILPHLNYNLLVWGNANKSHLHHLLLIQKRAVRNICNVSYTFHTTDLFKELHILPILKLYDCQLAIFMYKYHHNMLPPIFDSFYQFNHDFHHYNTRSKNLLHTPFSRTKINQCHIRHAGVALWNSLSDSQKSKPTLSRFKSSLKRNLFHAFDLC